MLRNCLFALFVWIAAVIGYGYVLRDFRGAGKIIGAGYGMTRCSVRAPYGEVMLGSFPVLEHVFQTEVDRDAAAEYIATTSFEQQDGVAGLLKAMLSVHGASPPLLPNATR